jgi:methyl-accepting chemotaxis protein
MDEVTQQNSALVEENAATARTLEHQAKTMDERVSYFRIDEAIGRKSSAPDNAQHSESAKAKVSTLSVLKRAAKAVGRGPVGRARSALATAAEVREF